MRWSQAWMLLALATFLRHSAANSGSAQPLRTAALVEA
jgi:hypothetical protein